MAGSLLAIISYGTSAIRDVAMLLMAGRTSILDTATVYVAIAATVAAPVALGISAVVGGRTRRGKFKVEFAIYAILLATWLLGTVVHEALAVLLVALIVIQQTFSVSAFAAGNYIPNSVASIVSSGFPIAVWATIGTDSVVKLLTGLLLGLSIQAFSSYYLSPAGSTKSPRSWDGPTGRRLRTLWPSIAVAASVQLFYLSGRLVFVGSAPGRIAEAGLALNLGIAAVTVLGSPLAIALLAGVPGVERSVKTLVARATLLGPVVALIVFLCRPLVRHYSLSGVLELSVIPASALGPLLSIYFVSRRASLPDIVKWRLAGVVAVAAGVSVVGGLLIGNVSNVDYTRSLSFLGSAAIVQIITVVTIRRYPVPRSILIEEVQ